MTTLCVLGLGYIGLPTASLFASQGHRVLGVDIDSERVSRLQQGDVLIDEPGLHVLVQSALGSGQLTVATEPGPADAFIIAVPTPVTPQHRADLSHVKRSVQAIIPHLRPGNLIILESTVPPGTTRDLIKPPLEAIGLKVGQTLFVAHCPERVLPGRILHELVANDRVVGGVTPACAAKAGELYRQAVEGQIVLTDATTAETVKLMENTYRDVNIALANELARLSSAAGIDAWEVIRLANHHPRVQLHQPGPGVGGHCISVDPWFLVDAFPAETPLIRLARERNDQMPAWVAQSVFDWVGKSQPTIAVLGVTYKGNVDDTRESPARYVIEQLSTLGASVPAHDPRVSQCTIPLLSLEEAVTGADAAILLADHDSFRSLSPQLLADLMRERRIYDTRRCLNPDDWQSAGFEVQQLGRAH